LTPGIVQHVLSQDGQGNFPLHKYDHFDENVKNDFDLKEELSSETGGNCPKRTKSFFVLKTCRARGEAEEREAWPSKLSRHTSADSRAAHHAATSLRPWATQARGATQIRYTTAIFIWFTMGEATQADKQEQRKNRTAPAPKEGYGKAAEAYQKEIANQAARRLLHNPGRRPTPIPGGCRRSGFIFFFFFQGLIKRCRMPMDPTGAGGYQFNHPAPVLHQRRNASTDANKAFQGTPSPADPTKEAESSYQLGVSLVGKGEHRQGAGKGRASPKPKGALQKYLELAPTAQPQKAQKGCSPTSAAPVRNHVGNKKKSHQKVRQGWS